MSVEQAVAVRELRLGRERGLAMLQPVLRGGRCDAGTERFDARDLERDRALQFTRGQLWRDLEVRGFAAATRPDQHLGAAGGEPVDEALRQDGQAGYDDEAVALERGVGRDDVDVESECAQRRIPLERLPQRAEARALRLDVGDPDGGVVEDQRDGRMGARCHGSEPRDVTGSGPRFVRADVVLAVGAQEAGVHLLLREGRLPPAEIGDELRAVRHRLQRPEPHHAGERRGVARGPVHGSRLLLHHREASATAAAVEVVVERRDVGMALARVAELLGVAEPELLEEAERVAVPGDDIEVAPQGMVVEGGDEAHRVVRDIAAGRVCTQDVDLLAVERQHLVRGEALEVERVGGVGFGDGERGRVDLIERPVLGAPEHRAPGVVERRDVAVACGEPAAEGLRRCSRMADHGVVAAVFVVGLPGDDGRVSAVAGRHCFGDALRLGAVAGVREAVMPTRAETARSTLGIDGDHVRHRVHQPFGRRRGGRAKDDAEAVAVQRLERAIEPVPVEPAVRGFDAAPGELADAYACETHRRHAPRVVFPP